MMVAGKGGRKRCERDAAHACGSERDMLINTQVQSPRPLEYSSLTYTVGTDALQSVPE